MTDIRYSNLIAEKFQGATYQEQAHIVEKIARDPDTDLNTIVVMWKESTLHLMDNLGSLDGPAELLEFVDIAETLINKIHKAVGL